MAKATGKAMVWTAIDTPLEPREYALPEVEDDAMLSRTRNTYPFEKLVSHKFKLEDVNKGIQQSLEGKVVRAGLVPG